MPGDAGVLRGALLPALSRTQDQHQNTSLMRASPSPAASMAPSQIPCSSLRAAHSSIHPSVRPLLSPPRLKTKGREAWLS